MRRRFFKHFAASVALIALGGCVQATRHSNTMVFGTNTSFGLKVGTTAGQTPEILVGYDRQEAVIMPLVANVKSVNGNLEPCDFSQEVRVNGGGTYAIHPCSLVAYRDGAQDSYSVLASFGAKFGGKSGGAGVEAQGGLAQYFATGMAAQYLALNGGAAVVATGPAATEAVRTSDPASLASALSGNAKFAAARPIAAQASLSQKVLIGKIKNTAPADLASRLTRFESRAGVSSGGAQLCASKTPSQCADLIAGRDFYADGYVGHEANFDAAVLQWDSD